MAQGLGTIQKKILLLLLGGLALGLSGSPKRYYRTIRLIGKEWQELDRENLWRSIRSLYRSKLIEEKYNRDGSVTLILSKQGKKFVLKYKLDEIRIQPQSKWDRKWRIVTFDIPESRKKARDALRFRLRQMGMKEYQKSVFICPYPCDSELEFIIEFYQIRPFVRQILAESIDNELHYKQKFGII